MTRTAAIIGGGIGGLAVANALVRNGWEVTVHERADALPQAGTALGMWPEALAALDMIGLGGRVRETGSRQEGGQIRTHDGAALATIRPGGEKAVLISRAPLLSILASGLPEGVVRFSAAVNDVAELTRHDLVVGADGVGSRVRAAVLGRRVDPVMLGWSALIGRAAGTTDVVCETWGEGRLFGITPRDGGVTNWFASYRDAPDGPMPADPMAFLRQHYGHWHSDIRDVLGRIDEESIIHYRAKQMPKLPTYVRGGIALVGDAAHAMAPNLGRGACETIIDAVTLAEELETGSVEDALRRYDAQRRPATQRLVAGSRMVGRLALSRRLPAVRNGVVRTLARVA